MRKLMILGASIVVLTAAIATPLANAAVSYDNARVGHVDKGDVQALFGWNDATLQKNATDVMFSNKQVDAMEISWSCANGDIHDTDLSGTATHTLKDSELRNKAGKVTDWTLNGFDGPAIIENTDTGPAYDCPIDNPWDWMSTNNKSSFTTTNVVQVTYGDISYDLPVTPVAVT